jgi:hypothetical protein
MTQSKSPGKRDSLASEGARLSAELILVAYQTDSFLLLNNGTVACPRITFPFSTASVDFGALVEDLVTQQLGIRAEYLGLLATPGDADQSRLVISAISRTEPGGRPDPQALRWFSYDEIPGVAGTLPKVNLFAEALSIRAAKNAAADLEPAIQRSFTMAVDYLSKHLSTEADLKGWDQYQDGSTIGVLSTAQGLLCHVYAGYNGPLVDEAAATLEKLQNPDGGWQVRRALIGEQSEISITESTCYCLWALHAAGRSDLSDPTRNAIKWLEGVQGAGGGWRSSPRVAETQVGPSAAAVTVLSRYARASAVERGANWLRSVQCPDGGWGPTAPTSPLGRDFTSPAYTAHVIIALLASGASSADPVIERGCKYLEETFDSRRDEPWRPTSFNTLVDPNTSSRLDFRHFATPWAVVALAMAGRGIGNPVTLGGVNLLLALQDSAGAWRCELTAPDARPIWATHDALYALRTIITASDKNLRTAAMAPYWIVEQRLLGRTLVQLITQPHFDLLAASPVATRTGRRWLQTTWLSLLTTVVAVILLQEFGVFRLFKSDIATHRILGAVVTAVVAFIGATLPQVAAEEYRIRRTRHENERGQE